MNTKNIQKLNQEIQPTQESAQLQTLTLEQLTQITGGALFKPTLIHRF